MTPGVFAGTDAVDEYTFMHTPGAARKLAEHRRTFITEEDFAWIAEHGLGLVRIPVGHWILDGNGPYQSGSTYLDWAFTMAERYRLQVLICLHGAPGSQNGWDHSGRAGKAAWFDDAVHRTRTKDVLAALATRYAGRPALWGIELLNEPRIGFLQRTLRQFYREAQHALEPILPRTAHIIFSDGFTPLLLNGAIRQRRQPVMIGEWSGVIAGEILKRYDTRLHAGMERDHIRRQLRVYRRAAVWCYWTYKTEAPGIWNYRSLVDADPGAFELV